MRLPNGNQRVGSCDRHKRPSQTLADRLIVCVLDQFDQKSALALWTDVFRRVRNLLVVGIAIGDARD